MSVKVAALPVESATPFKPLRTLDVFAGCGGRAYSSGTHPCVRVKECTGPWPYGGGSGRLYFLDADPHCFKVLPLLYLIYSLKYHVFDAKHVIFTRSTSDYICMCVADLDICSTYDFLVDFSCCCVLQA
jgi:hypothetical protein